MPGKIENLLVRAAAANAQNTSVTSAARLFQTAAEAEKTFTKLRGKLFDIKRWNDESKIMSFSLYDATGAAATGKRAAVGDYIKAVLPLSGKNDWIEIVEIFDEPEEIGLTVSPSRSPVEKTKDEAVSHFFAADSTNNFCLQKSGAEINFHVIGLNERTNTEKTENIIETVRNAAVANIGYWFGIQKTQWQTFCENFINEK